MVTDLKQGKKEKEIYNGKTLKKRAYMVFLSVGQG